MTSLAQTLAATASKADLETFRTVRSRIDPDWIRDALQCGEALSVRRRKMPNDVVVWLIIAVCLYGGRSFMDLVQTLGLTPPTRRGTPQRPPTSQAVAAARERVGSGPMCELFRISSGHWRDLPDFDHLRFHGLQVCAIDGFTCRTPDTDSNNAEFGKPSSRREAAAYPQVRGVCVIDAVTHLVLDAVLGPYDTGEITLTEELVGRLPDRSVTVLDRGFNAFALLHRIGAAGTDRHWLVRAKRSLVPTFVRELGRGDTLVELKMSAQARKDDPSLPATVLARRIEYKIGNTSYILHTSLLDPVRFPKEDVVALYHQRWEVELAIDDLKTELRDSAITLRSKTPDGVYQELYALFVAHNVLRVEMARAAVLLGVPPTRISFHRALVLATHHIACMGTTTAPSKLADREMELRHLLGYLLLPERRSERQYPRAVKVALSKYPRKVVDQRQELA